MTNLNNNNLPKIEIVYELRENTYEIKTSQLSPAARSKIIKMYGGNYVSERGKEGYGPCHSCGDKNLTFKLEIRLKNGGELGGIVRSTEHAERAAREIKNSEGHWEGSFRTGPFPQRNREMLANKIMHYVDRHKNGEEIDASVSAGSDGECFVIM